MLPAVGPGSAVACIRCRGPHQRPCPGRSHAKTVPGQTYPHTGTDPKAAQSLPPTGSISRRWLAAASHVSNRTPELAVGRPAPFPEGSPIGSGWGASAPAQPRLLSEQGLRPVGGGTVARSDRASVSVCPVVNGPAGATWFARGRRDAPGFRQLRGQPSHPELTNGC